MSELEKRLRASLRRHAADAPDGDRLVERILRETSARPAPSRRRREWRTWTLPLATAGAVAAIAAALVGVNQVHHSASAPPAVQLPSVARLTELPTTLPTDGATPAVTPTSTQPTVPPSLTNVHVLDATFVGPKDGWLLANAKCLDGKPGQCTAMLRTTDGGTHWTSFKPPPANVPAANIVGVQNCATSCVNHIRFATAKTGYAYGPSTFYMTTDGGSSWTEQPGGAVALETLDGNVIRVTTTQPGCGPPGCMYAVETSDIGSSKWTPRTLPGSYDGGMTVGADLVRADQDAYVLVRANTAGGAGSARSTLFRSSDDGATWHNAGEPCPQLPGYGEVDSASVAAGHGQVGVTCVTRQAPQHAFVAVSPDGGAHFGARGKLLASSTELLVGDPTTVLLSAPASGTGAVYRSTDGGGQWIQVPGVLGPVSWLGFESTTVGRIISGDGRTIWTTNDAGAHWTPFTFG